jgi:hypothetical protein
MMPEWRKRAERFPLPLPLRYRVSGASDWSPGQTQNISGSGVLFRTECELAVGTQIELRLTLEADGTWHPAQVVARARVVAMRVPDSPCTQIAVAAKFEMYELVRRQVGVA